MMAGIKSLTEEERKTVFQCMVAIYRGPFISDTAFRPVMGVGREELRQILDAWPAVDDSCVAAPAYLAINNSMAHMVYGRRAQSVWSDWVDVPREEAERVFVKWKQPAGSAEA
jgi:hypothetical protein